MENKEHKSKHFDDPKKYFELVGVMMRWQPMHNSISNDYKMLLELTENSKEDKPKFEMLCRTCIRNILALMEADIYTLNRLDSYEEYTDRDDFNKRFKETYKQVCKTWDRVDLQQEYFSTKIKLLNEVKAVRNKLIHPKDAEDFIIPTENDFNKVKQVFEDYNNFINALMSNFFLSTTVPIDLDSFFNKPIR